MEAVGEPEAASLRGLSAFVNSNYNSEPVFYSSEMSLTNNYASSHIFNLVLTRRRSRAVESECLDSDKSPIFRIAPGDLLEAVRTLVACPTWTHAQLRFSDAWLLRREDFVRRFEDLIFEIFSLLKTSPSLSSFDFRSPRHILPSYFRRLRSVIVYPWALGTTNSRVLAKSIALYLSRNSVLRSVTIQLASGDFKLDRETLEILVTPLTTASPSEANVGLKELVLHLLDFADPDERCEDALANLVRCNTTLEKLELRFSDFKTCLEEGMCTEIGRALEVNHTLKEFGCFCDRVGLGELLAPFVPDRSGRQPNTTVSTLNLFLSHYFDERREQDFATHGLVVILRHLASMLELNTTLKHVLLTHEWGRDCGYTDKEKWINRRQVEFGTEEKLRMMMCKELRVNTSLETLAVGFWQLRRVGAEWQTSYGGPCLGLKQSKEYIVKVKLCS
ncbi:hypothetical protein KC19_6G204500 [Ceratodon purpureus]|uniref:Uncharacterized protein n=1 Tax=Ceratodon purpureus TaxID=3225 RepID=A0A8T0HJN4_CERPU|nr:hypothetical protein KC19_6G204500 [Ceratodon purpureus]